MTKTDKSRQLNTKQKTAIPLIISGKNDSEVADSVGVTRQTVNGWRNHDSLFVAELNACRQELWGNNVDRIRSLANDAIDVLQEELHCDDLKLRHSAAVTLLRGVGMIGGNLYPEGDTDPATVEMEWEKETQMRFTEALFHNYQTSDKIDRKENSIK